MTDYYEYSLKWDGEWQVTYEICRDMGIAYGVGRILIDLLVVAQFRSYLVPLIIMAPIPLTLIGIIVRDSILLVDFINRQVCEGSALEDAAIDSAVVRAKPIMLTALAAMAGAVFTLDDPIFSGLAVSLLFGLFVSTVLPLVVYYGVMRKRVEWIRGAMR